MVETMTFMDDYSHHITRMARRTARHQLRLKIHDILLNEWDPLYINDTNQPFGFVEANSVAYSQYEDELEHLVFEGAAFSKISDQLMNAEENMLANGEIRQASRRRCDVIAVMVARYGPHYLENPFVVCINVETPEAAYQTVLDLVLQTRLDAYAKNWDGVRIGYEKALEICNTHLPGQRELICACLNNLGQALTELGQLDIAQVQFEMALCHTDFDGQTANSPYKVCLANLILQHEHSGNFSAATNYLHALRAYSLIGSVADDSLTWFADDYLKDLGQPAHEPDSLSRFRLAVAQDELYG